MQRAAKIRNFGIVGRESERNRSCEDAPDLETANEVLNVSESSPGNDTDVSNVNLVSNSEMKVLRPVLRPFFLRSWS